jgi:GNAT superfamily N-acetyltransferase
MDLIPVDHDPYNDPPTNLIPVDHNPFTDRDAAAWKAAIDPATGRPNILIQRSPEGVVPKSGQTVQPVNTASDVAAMPGKVAGTVGDMLGVTDAMRALRGEMTPEEAQTFAMGAATMVLGGPEAKAAEEATPAAFRTLGEFRDYWNAQGVKHFVGDLPNRNQYNLSQIVVPKDQRSQGIGSAFMNQLTDLADANGRTVTATPSIDFGGSSVARLKDFYKGFGFVENKGRNKDFSISDSMYRPPAPIQSGQPVPQELAQAGIRAFHGSPYDFNTFDLSNIGTGEGAQAYGHGLYFAENPATAQAYRDSLSDLKPRTVEGSPDLTVPSWVAKKVESGNPIAINDVRADFQNRLAGMKAQLADPATAQPWLVESNIPGIENILKALDHVESGAKIAPAGRMYEVNINADPEHFLDWDKPMSEQSSVVRQAFLDNLKRRQRPQAKIDDVMGPTTNGQQALNYIMPSGAKSQATEVLRDAGIPGIKYLDQGSRGKSTWTATHPQGGVNEFPNEQQARAFVAKNPEYSLKPPDQTRNYVVFNDKLIDIVKKYGLAGLIAGGAGHFQTTPVDHDPFEASQ